MKKVFLPILLIAVVIRLFGIDYGLPMWLIGDEPSNILGALKMVEVRTLLPTLHAEEFKSILYYPPYLSYLYLPLFFILGTIKAVLFALSNGNLNGFIPFLTSDLSIFFIGARILQIIFAATSVYFVYDTAKRYLHSRAAALMSAGLIALSPLHIALSIGARPWLAVSTAVAFVIWILTKENLAYRKRLTYALLGAGFAVGANTLGGLVFLLIPLWHFLGEKRGVREFILLWPYGFLSAFLTLLPRILHHQSNGFTVDLTGHATKTLLGLLQSPFLFFENFFISEPIFFSLAVLGAFWGIRKLRPIESIATLSIVFYPAIFYLLFRNESRFILPIMPLLAISAGSLVSRITKERTRNTLIGASLVLVTIPTIGMMITLHKNDSRVSAARESLKILSDRKVAYDIDLFRIPGSEESLLAQERFDPSSLRRVDRAELAQKNSRENLPHTFNITTLNHRDMPKIVEHLRKEGFEYLLIQEDRLALYSNLSLTKIAEYGLSESYSLTHSEPRKNFLEITKGVQSGPKIHLYKLIW